MMDSSEPTGKEKTDGHEISEEEIDETLKESFPASDPPAWTLGMEHHTEDKPETKEDDAE